MQKLTPSLFLTCSTRSRFIRLLPSEYEMKRKSGLPPYKSTVSVLKSVLSRTIVFKYNWYEILISDIIN